MLLVYAARHYRELSNKNQLRPQDLMRVLVHYHAYGDPMKAARFVRLHGNRLGAVIDRDESEEVARITAEHQPTADRLAKVEADLANVDKKHATLLTRTADKLRKDLVERDERIADARNRAAEERQAIEVVGQGRRQEQRLVRH